jgi:hypothetical protein
MISANPKIPDPIGLSPIGLTAIRLPSTQVCPAFTFFV